jgi:hypothetical protein
MELCPQCSRTYAGETITFCVIDGALLSAPFDPGATPISPSVHKVPPTTVGVAPVKQPAPQITGYGYAFNRGHIVILLLAVMLSGSVVALFYERGKGDSNSKAKQSEAQVPASTPTGPEQSIARSTLPVNNQTRFSVNPCNSIYRRADWPRMVCRPGSKRDLGWSAALDGRTERLQRRLADAYERRDQDAL